MARPNLIAVVGSLAGAVVIAFTAYWSLTPVRPSTPLGTRFGGNAVLALEFVETPAQLSAILGDARGPGSVRAALDTINRADFFYLLAYAALLATGFITRVQRGGSRRLLVGAALAVVAAAGDAFENRALLALTSDGADVPAALASLHRWTLLKWELLGPLTAVLGVSLFREHHRHGVRRAAAGFATITALASVPLGLGCLANPSLCSPLLTLALAPTWVWVWRRHVGHLFTVER